MDLDIFWNLLRFRDPAVTLTVAVKHKNDIILTVVMKHMSVIILCSLYVRQCLGELHLRAPAWFDYG